MSSSTATVTKIARIPEHNRPLVEVVAVVLSDGSLVEVPDSIRYSSCRAGTSRLANGVVSGDGWTLWWERRTYEEGR